MQISLSRFSLIWVLVLVHSWPVSHCRDYIFQCCSVSEPNAKRPKTAEAKAESNNSLKSLMEAAISVYQSLPVSNISTSLLSSLWLGRPAVPRLTSWGIVSAWATVYTTPAPCKALHQFVRMQGSHPIYVRLILLSFSIRLEALQRKDIKLCWTFVNSRGIKGLTSLHRSQHGFKKYYNHQIKS